MRIAILGAGPAGLYLSFLIKRRAPQAEVIVIEQNPADVTWGFGVVFSDRALEFLREDDEETYAAIVPHMESWHDMTLAHRGERVVIDGIGFAAIGRLKLLQLLQARARSVGIAPVYRRAVTSLDDRRLRSGGRPTASTRWCGAARGRFHASVISSATALPGSAPKFRDADADFHRDRLAF